MGRVSQRTLALQSPRDGNSPGSRGSVHSCTVFYYTGNEAPSPPPSLNRTAPPRTGRPARAILTLVPKGTTECLRPRSVRRERSDAKSKRFVEPRQPHGATPREYCWEGMIVPRQADSPRSPSGSRRRVVPEGRRHARFAVRLSVRCRRLTARASRTWRGRTADVGGGGFGVELPTRLPPGTPLAIEVRTGIGPLWMEAQVLWTRRVAGRVGITRHGVCLADHSEVLDLPVGALLGQWLQGVARRSGKRVPTPAQSREGRKP